MSDLVKVMSRQDGKVRAVGVLIERMVRDVANGTDDADDLDRFFPLFDAVDRGELFVIGQPVVFGRRAGVA